MSRRARFIIPNLPHHILNRANNKEIIFRDENDFCFFLRQAKKYKQKFKIKIYHYCVMPNHYHFIIEPPTKESLTGFMQALMLVYAQYVQRKYGKIGHIWQERYKSPVIQTEDYLANCGYYVEDNPRRAGLLKNLKDWPWSSYPFYAYGKPDPIVDIDPNYLALGTTLEERQQNYRRHIIIAEEKKWLDGVRQNLAQGILGSQEFVKEMVEKFKIKLVKAGQRGRPRKI
ncbi:MAG: transposase [Minisyncoccales bacterium]